MMRYILFAGDGEEPTKAYPGDAGFDLYCSETVEIPHGEFRDVPCGISIELPPRVWVMITGRSSTLRNRKLLVSQGIIDNGYRGPIFAGVHNLGRLPAVVEKGERIAQMIPFDLTAAMLRFRKTNKLHESDRGTKGFGSTGA